MKAGGGKKPIKVRWVDTDKGDRYRSRLVAMEFRKPNETYFAGTPPLESLRVLCKFLADKRRGQRGSMVMATIDVKRAHFHAMATRRLFIELPAEDARSSEADVVGELVMSLYGTRDAAFN